VAHYNFTLIYGARPDSPTQPAGKDAPDLAALLPAPNAIGRCLQCLAALDDHPRAECDRVFAADPPKTAQS